jgi:hypothetical protein
MSSQLALKHLYSPALTAALLSSTISIAGGVFTTRNLVTNDELDRKLDGGLRSINDTLARYEKLLEKMATKAEMNELRQMLLKKTRCYPW